MIEPNTVLYVINNIIADPSYSNVLYFNNAAEQQNYYINNNTLLGSFNTLSYQRQDARTIRVNAPYSQLSKAQYIAFKNTSYENKYIYGFVDSVEYISDNVTQIIYDIDVMQTYAFDYELMQSFIDREHAASDTIGANIEPEDVAVNSLQCYQYNKIEAAETKIRVYVSETFNGSFPISQTAITPDQIAELENAANWNSPPPHVVGTDYVSVLSVVFESAISLTALVTLQAIIDNYNRAGKADAILYAVISPGRITRGASTTNINYQEAFTPQNKKLYQYPFTAIQAFTYDGATQTYYPERFGDIAKFNFYGEIEPLPDFVLSPVNYNGQTTPTQYELHAVNFPSVAMKIDSFTNWMATNRNMLSAQASTIDTNYNVNIATSLISGATSLITSAVSGNVTGTLGATTSLINSTIRNTANYEMQKEALKAQYLDKITIPDSIKGQAVASYNALYGNLCFYICTMSLPEKERVIIDNYFSRYGYKTNKIKVPNRNVRTRFTFTKTNGVTVKGNLPANIIDDINRVYNAGVTFWRVSDGSVNNYGNYTALNPIG